MIFNKWFRKSAERAISPSNLKEFDWTRHVEGMFSKCPICGAPVIEHQTASLGLANLSTAEERALALAFDEHDWSTAMNIRTGDSKSDNCEIKAFRCRAGDRLFIIRLVSYFDMWLDDVLTGTAILGEEESRSLSERIAPENWKSVA
jgi:hypothetical protein